jgi:hypothetical protein
MALAPMQEWIAAAKLEPGHGHRVVQMRLGHDQAGEGEVRCCNDWHALVFASSLHEICASAFSHLHDACMEGERVQRECFADWRSA